MRKAEKWRDEFEKLRTIALDCGLNEELKWGKPCYTDHSKNIVLIHGFNDYCALLFFKGALMKDAGGLLIQQTRNVQAGRQVRFANLHEIGEREAILKAYVHEAVEVERSGQKTAFKQTADFPVADEFRKKLDESPRLKAAFNALTPGRQRAYLLYFAAPKQSKTRESRIEKNIGKILDGVGLND
ncbi:YdeI/OmpD-associated family protein [Rhodoblastus sp.]|uniref:YdeI/OmpD-associated family protein n=1 Tax=Rhodoblastus sp. TaxID=1962975 RepID=UPI003FD8B1D3